MPILLVRARVSFSAFQSTRLGLSGLKMVKKLKPADIEIPGWSCVNL